MDVATLDQAFVTAAFLDALPDKDLTRLSEQQARDHYDHSGDDSECSIETCRIARAALRNAWTRRTIWTTVEVPVSVPDALKFTRESYSKTIKVDVTQKGIAFLRVALDHAEREIAGEAADDV